LAHGFALGGRVDTPGSALKQSLSQPGFQGCETFGHCWWLYIEDQGGRAQAALVSDGYHQLKVTTVHCFLVRNNKLVDYCLIGGWPLFKISSMRPAVQPATPSENAPAVLLEGFEVQDVNAAAGLIRSLRKGGGKPLLLLHGHPQTHVMWHLVAPRLAEHFCVVLMDLRGYGDSARLASDSSHAAYSKRQMAADAIAVMAHHGFDSFQVLAHDRGARVAHRLASDFPQAVERLMLLDIAPTLEMYRNTSEAFATAYWHWFFLIQPPPLPEALIESDPVRYLRSVMGKRHAGLAAFTPAALAEYERCVQIAGTAQAICEDYRASATIDLEHDRLDVAASRKINQPLRVLWGQHGAVGQCFEVLDLWRERAGDVSGISLPCGHYIAEEAPDLLLAQCMQFFKT
jgi:haloacetate dehalogenase